MRAHLDTKVPSISAILTPQNFHEQDEHEKFFYDHLADYRLIQFQPLSWTVAVHPGVVRLSCGAWYDPARGGEYPACAHGNANFLARDDGTSRLSQGPNSVTALVQVEKCTNSPHQSGAFEPVPLQGGCRLMNSAHL
jgi:hypothetical protein